MNAQLARTSPAPFAPRLRPSDHLYRAATAALLAQRRNVSADVILKTHPAYADDKVTPLVLRTATNPAVTTTAAWAGNIALATVADFVVGLAGPSAAASLIAMGLRVSLTGHSSITIPARLMVAADTGFVAEGEPIPVRQFNVLGGPTLAPHKLAVICTFTRELADHAVQNFEAVVKQLLSEAAALALDAAMFSTTAGSAVRPPGILNGVTGLTPAAGGGENAVAKDIGLLVNALAAAGAGKDVVFIAAPGQAASLRIWAGPMFNFPILASAALAAGTVIAVEASSFVSAFSPTPEFLTSEEALIHHEDTTPLPIATGTQGSGVLATPTRSLWQTDCIAVRMILRAGWNVRAAGHVQFMNAVTW